MLEVAVPTYPGIIFIICHANVGAAVGSRQPVYDQYKKDTEYETSSGD
jgi:hypothetical protein